MSFKKIPKKEQYQREKNWENDLYLTLGALTGTARPKIS